jgi:hypothetical protein
MILYLIYDEDKKVYTTLADYEQRHQCIVHVEEDPESDANDGEKGDESE